MQCYVLTLSEPNLSFAFYSCTAVFVLFCMEYSSILIHLCQSSYTQIKLLPFGVSEGLFGRAPALPKTAPALAPQMERLLWWSWSRFRKCLAKQLHLLD